mmetsp:Transcript_36180/g.91317  ORF Transcript_36180/g.91317 Transcript_36180/m.91317 type:complete len:696 (+) Transcript_36180:139-2226(+)|eukprot:jgi/Tetstr1/434895/TSEL_023892.t1
MTVHGTCGRRVAGGEPKERLAGGKHAIGLEHLRTSQLKLLLSAAGQEVAGDRSALLDRIREQVIGDVELEWVTHRIHTETPIREDCTLVEHDGELYIFGGRDANSDYGSQELLKLSRKSGIWEVVENIGTWPERRFAHSAVTYGNKMYVWGGQRDTNSERYFNDMHCFDFRTHYWHEVKQQGSIPEARSYAKAVIHGKHLLLYGGVDTERGGTGKTEFAEGAGTIMQFDFETSTWSQTKAGGPPTTKPLPIFLEAFASHNDSLYTMTYDYHKQDQPLVIHKLDLGKMKWHKVKAKGNAPSARTKVASVVLGNQWVVHGGLQMSQEEDEDEEEEKQHDQPSDECYIFSFDTETWTQPDFIGRSPIARGGHAACELLGSMLLVGGHLPKQRNDEDGGSEGSERADEEEMSGLESDESGYTVDSAEMDEVGNHEAHRDGADADSEDRSRAGSVASEEGEADSDPSRSDSLHTSGDEGLLNMIEVLRPRPAGPACDRLANVDLASSLTRFFNCESHSDVVLMVDNKRFPTHRLVLAAQSEIFDAMFQGGMKEDTTGEVVVKDMRPEVMRSFLSYLYGCLDAIRPDQAMELFRASDRYGVISLRNECLHMLKCAIDASNAAAIAQLADEHQCSELFQACIKFTANCSELPRVVGSAAYMDLMRSYPELAQKFVRLAAEMQAEAGRTAEAANSRRKKKRRR